MVKLQPKKRAATGAPLAVPADREQLFDGISGSVCSVKMPTDEVVQMLEGKLANTPTLPNPPLILAHTISVAYLGFGKTPPYFLRNLFTVRRKAILAAIKWLSLNNPVYKNVAIDEEAVAALPEEGIPDSIVVRDGASAYDVALAASEGVGYTRRDDESEEDEEKDEETQDTVGVGLSKSTCDNVRPKTNDRLYAAKLTLLAGCTRTLQNEVQMRYRRKTPKLNKVSDQISTVWATLNGSAGHSREALPS